MEDKGMKFEIKKAREANPEQTVICRTDGEDMHGQNYMVVNADKPYAMEVYTILRKHGHIIPFMEERIFEIERHWEEPANQKRTSLIDLRKEIEMTLSPYYEKYQFIIFFKKETQFKSYKVKIILHSNLTVDYCMLTELKDTLKEFGIEHFVVRNGDHRDGGDSLIIYFVIHEQYINEP